MTDLEILKTKQELLVERTLDFLGADLARANEAVCYSFTTINDVIYVECCEQTKFEKSNEFFITEKVDDVSSIDESLYRVAILKSIENRITELEK